MNPTLYTQLAPLGFAEWLEKNHRCMSVMYLTSIDTENIDSLLRTELNALAFRWMRQNNIDCQIYELKKGKYRCSIWVNGKFNSSIEPFDTHELAEHEALNKALEILSKGGENGL